MLCPLNNFEKCKKKLCGFYIVEVRLKREGGEIVEYPVTEECSMVNIAKTLDSICVNGLSVSTT